MSGEEFADLYTFIRTTYSDATAALTQAEIYAKVYGTAERTLIAEIASGDHNININNNPQEETTDKENLTE